ncbi:MAG: Ig-like domain-containing protein, partial [Lachnospiraceae bacterium]|nr:Ig-like domain-containing protein [Lachnospiraceae bacterium]
VMWKTSNDKIATVDGNGKVTAIAKGRVTITAYGMINNRVAMNYAIQVRVPASKVVINTNTVADTKMYVVKGTTFKLNTTLTPTETEDKLTYKSSKKKVVKVDANGNVTAVKKGKAVITVTADSGKKDKITIYVVKKPTAAKKIKLKTKSIKVGKTVRLKMTLTSAKSTDTLTYSVDKPEIATIDQFGYLKGVKKGKVKVTIKASSGATITKTVKVKK